MERDGSFQSQHGGVSRARSLSGLETQGFLSAASPQRHPDGHLPALRGQSEGRWAPHAARRRLCHLGPQEQLEQGGAGNGARSLGSVRSRPGDRHQRAPAALAGKMKMDYIHFTKHAVTMCEAHAG